MSSKAYGEDGDARGSDGEDGDDEGAVTVMMVVKIGDEDGSGDSGDDHGGDGDDQKVVLDSTDELVTHFRIYPSGPILGCRRGFSPSPKWSAVFLLPLFSMRLGSTPTRASSLAGPVQDLLDHFVHRITRPSYAVRGYPKRDSWNRVTASHARH